MNRREFIKLAIATCVYPSLESNGLESTRQPNIVSIEAQSVADLTCYDDNMVTSSQKHRHKAFRDWTSMHSTFRFKIDLNENDIFLGDFITIDCPQGKYRCKVIAIDFPRGVCNG